MAFFPLKKTFAVAAATLLIASFAAHGEDAAVGEVDAVTAASVDATTGASKQLEPIKVSDSFSVAYAINDDGALFIQARDLTDAYRRDELASDSLFKGKTIVVRGTIEKTSKPGAARPWITLEGDEESGKKIRCSLRPELAAGKRFNPGDVVQVTGVCDGMKLNIALLEGEIIE